MNLASLFIKRPGLVTVDVLLAVILGVVSMVQVPTDLLRNLNVPTVAIVTVFPGAYTQGDGRSGNKTNRECGSHYSGNFHYDNSGVGPSKFVLIANYLKANGRSVSAAVLLPVFGYGLC